MKLVESDNALLGELQTAKTFEEKAAIAVNHGCDVRAEELAAIVTVAGRDAGVALSEAELELVAGGSKIGDFFKKVIKVFYVDGSDGKRVVGVKGTIK